jgi:asparagine synthase (glutamine-hydrolysing)
MCGIAGIVATGDPAPLERAVATMTGCLAHRGPDGEGGWTDPDGGIVLGHRRLAVVGLGPGGRQPMASADGRWVVTYNGEVYNHRELRSQMEAGHRFRGTSDTEVLVEAIARWGLDETLRRVNGMFAFGAWDRLHRRLHLVRDPIGEKPLYYAALGRGLAFASELKALEALEELDRAWDRSAVATYLRLGHFPSPLTPYERVSKVCPGEVVEVDAAGAAKGRPYWRLDEELADAPAGPPRGVLPPGVPPPGVPPPGLDEIEGLIRDAVRLRLQADVPVGVFLSGGIDSSVVAALAVTAGSGPVRTFTVGFSDPAMDESADGRAVAEALGTRHEQLDVDVAEGIEVARGLPGVYDEPFCDPSAVPTLLLARAARQRVTVCLSGDGGDEVFGGYNRYLLGSELWPLVGRVPLPLRRGASRVLEAVPPAALDRTARLLPGRLAVRNPGDKLHRLATLLGTRDDAELPLRLVSIWPDRLPLAGRETPTAFTRPESWPAGLGPTEQLMYLDSVVTLPDLMLTKVDRASMACSLEVRVPLLDLRVVRAAWRAPGLRLAGGQTKRALRLIAARHLPPGLLERPKMGFDPPLGAWLRGPLRAWAEDLLAPAALARTGLDAAPVRATWASFLRGRRLDYRVWSVLMLQAWAEGRG